MSYNKIVFRGYCVVILGGILFVFVVFVVLEVFDRFFVCRLLRGVVWFVLVVFCGLDVVEE